jgi:hypothetical protein
MMRTQWVLPVGVVLVCLAMAGGVLPGSATAQPSSVDRAARVPIDVVEVVSGGNWVQGAARGFWRVVTVMVPNTVSSPDSTTVSPIVPHCEVFVQWIGSRTPGAPFEILSASPLTAFNTLELPAASVSLESDSNQGARVVVTGESTDGLLTMLTFFVKSPGEVALVPVEGPLSPANGRSAQAANVPQ